MLKNTKFVSTRGGKESCIFSEAIMDPSAKHGGLWVPEIIPLFDENIIKEMFNLSYKDLAFKVLREFGVDLQDDFIIEAVQVYDNFDNPDNPVPVVGVTNDISVAELWHGPTRAFKDMALQPFSQLVSNLAKDKNFLILTATSGDTGPAALSGFRNLPNTKVACLYPYGGTSNIQGDQMKKEDGENLKVLGVKSDFDATQKALKKMIKSDEFGLKVKKVC
jgi:threonine synthase